MEFRRYHGLGNDYIVIDPANNHLALSPDGIRLICDRHFGIGADGILYGPEDPVSQTPSVRIFNPDGSEAEKSGNGLRIFARYLVDVGYRPVGVAFTIRTAGGTVRARVLHPSERIEIEMGRASFVSTAIPMTGPPREVVGERLTADGADFTVVGVTVGNPHCVIPMRHTTADDARRIGPLIENHPAFPRRTNVQFLEVLDRANVRIEIWERGAGYTLASGSSSCATAAAAHRLGLVDAAVTVHMPGGTLSVTIGEGYDLRLAGPVRAVASGNFADDLQKALAGL